MAAVKQVPELIGQTFSIQVAGRPNLVLEVKDRVVLAEPRAGAAQQFLIDGTQIRVVGGKNALDSRGGLKAGVDVIPWGAHGGANQQWAYNPITQEIRSTTQNLVFSVAGGKLEPGTNVIIEAPNQGANQNFEFVINGGAAGPAFGLFRIEAAANPGLVLDISGGAPGDNAKVILWNSSGALNQRFRFIGDTIAPLHSGKVLDASGGLGAGHGVIQFKSHGGPNQRWLYNPATQQIKSTTQELVFEARNGKVDKGAEIAVAPPNDSPAQKFRLVIA
jgi:hypothetical protein